MRELGARVRAHRLRRGMAVKALAAAAHVTPRYIEMIEAGKRTPSLDTLDRIAVALSTRPSALLSAEADGGHEPALPRPA